MKLETSETIKTKFEGRVLKLANNPSKGEIKKLLEELLVFVVDYKDNEKNSIKAKKV